MALLGPRQVGKTTLAWALADQQGGATDLDLESPADAVRLSDPAAYFDAHRDELMVLDEVQRAPALFAELRGVIDRAGASSSSLLVSNATSPNSARALPPKHCAACGRCWPTSKARSAMRPSPPRRWQ